MEPLFVMRACQIGAYRGKTRGGMEIGENWRENDGLVNTVSARAPLGAPQKQFDKDHIEKGVWNILPDYPYDHMSFQGGLIIRHDPLAFYEELLGIINQL